MSDKQPTDPFFIGWEGKPAAVPVRHSKSRSLVFLIAAIALGGVAATLQSNFVGKGSWNLAEEKKWSGIFLATPHPTLVTDSGVHYVVLETKHSLPASDAAPLHLKHVEISGTLIEDADQPTSMIAVTELGSINTLGDAGPNPLDTAIIVGPATLRGEIADSKCALGAMNPGVFKPHRACAIACLSGGIPPLFIVRHGPDLPATHYLLVGDGGTSIHEAVLEHAALPVEISGNVFQLGDWRILKTTPRMIKLIE
jgi:hypothetical protein